jgi:acylglycerol lipase
MEVHPEIEHCDGMFKIRENCQIYEQWWLPKGEYKGMVVIVHGYAEHSGRYSHVGSFLAGHSYAAGAFDHCGHGKSYGKNTYVNKFDDYLDDLDCFLVRARERAGSKPVFMLGHSMGGLISALYVATRQPKLNGLLLSGAMVKLSDSISPALVKVSGLLGKIAPRLPTLTLDGSAVSRDPEVVKRYDSDPLNYRKGVPARTAAEMNKAVQKLQSNFGAIQLPLLVMYGSDDRLVDPAGSKMLFEGASSKDKSIKVYQGFYHEIMNEPEKEQVLGDIVTWLDMHL